VESTGKHLDRDCQIVRQTAFQRSLDPMLICDERRRCIDANVASCLFLRSSRATILESRIDDLLPPESRPGLRAHWEGFRDRAGPLRLGRFADALALPDGNRVAAGLSVAAFCPDRYLLSIDFPPVRGWVDDVQTGPRSASRILTARESQILTLVAHGKTGLQIAAELFLSPATVQTHVNNALLKLDAKNRSHGIATALCAGEIDFE
jgi:DNA-binding CsgD family transcriptional regulator